MRMNAMTGIGVMAGRTARGLILLACAAASIATLRIGPDPHAGGTEVETPTPAPGPAPAPAPAPGPAPAGAPPAGEAAAAAGPSAAAAMTGRIRGTVTDGQRKAKGGVLVKLASRRDPSLLRVTSTDEKGEYQFKDLPAGLYDVRVEAGGFRDATQSSIEVKPPFQNMVDVHLEPGGPAAAPAAGAPPGGAAVQSAAGPGATVRGAFLDSERRPLVEVSILLSSVEGDRLYQAISGEDGAFTLPGVPAGRYHVLVRSAGHVPIALKSVEVLPQAGLNLSLMLVDYALSARPGPEDSLPIERPRPLPAPSAPGAPSAGD